MHGGKILPSVAAGIVALSLINAPASARPALLDTTGMGPSSSQQVHITVSVAPRFKPLALNASSSWAGPGQLCFTSNVDVKSFELQVEALDGPPAAIASPTAPTLTPRVGQACVELAAPRRTHSGDLVYQSVIVSPL